MAKKVLNKGHREALESLAHKLVIETQDRAALDAAYEACANMVKGLVEAKFPPADMAVLKKYDQAYPDGCIYISAGWGGYERFNFRDGDERVPMRPGDRYGCNSRNPYLLNDEQTALYDAFKFADREHSDAIKTRYADYRALIQSARTFEELVEVWPAAEQLRERICGQSRAIAVMSEEVVARIKADPAATISTEA